MPTYALLGATGSTGSAIVRSLLAEPPTDLTLNIFVRSSTKLHTTFPDLSENPSIKINITEGLPNNATALQNCLKNADVIFACIATNESRAGISLVHDTALSIISALKAHRQSTSNYQTPTILQLRSASLNPTLSAFSPYIAHTMATFCFHQIYTDLERACTAFSSAAAESPGLLEHVFVDPPSIHDAGGTTRTGYRLLKEGEKQVPMLNYADLGAAFCELARRRGEFKGTAVGVSATGEVTKTWGVLIGYMAMGFRSRIWG